MIPWLLSHPRHAVVILMVLVCVIYLVGAVVWALLLDNEDRKRDRRVELESCLRHRPPQVLSFERKAAKGFGNRPKIGRF